jgi:hypothetical protein
VEHGGRREKMRTPGSSMMSMKKRSMGTEGLPLEEAWEEVTVPEALHDGLSDTSRPPSTGIETTSEAPSALAPGTQRG